MFSFLLTVLAIDVSPRYVNRHTCLVHLPTPDQLAMARVCERVADVLAVCDVEARHEALSIDDLLPHLDLTCHRGRVVGVCGLYGNEAVLEVVLALRAQGLSAVLIEDACLWTGPLAWLVDPDQPDWYDPRLDAVPRVRARDVLGPGEFEWDHELWAGAPPHLEPGPPP